LPDSSPFGTPFGPEEFAAATNVSRETLARLKLYAGLLKDWNSRHNLVSENSLKELWRRHFWDSAQLAAFVPQSAQNLADLGSGAGFPGLVLAEILRVRVSVTLYEARAKKCAFLEEAARRMELPVTIRAVRMEEAPPKAFDVVTARACAPLPKLMEYAQNFMGTNSVCLLLKGQNVVSELTQAQKYWTMNTVTTPSLTDPSGAVLALRNLVPHDSKSPKKAPHPGGRQPKGRRG